MEVHRRGREMKRLYLVSIILGALFFSCSVYYRPTNWAFLFGDRQNVPSSRDNEDPERRWFVEEIERILPLIAETDKKIWKYTEGGVK